MLNLGKIFYQIGVDTGGLNKAGRDVKQFQDKTNRSFKSVDRTANLLRNTIASIITFETIRRATLLADSYGLLQDRIKSVVGDANRASAAFNQLQGISEKTGASMDTIAGGFQKLQFAKDTVRATDQEMIRLTQSFAELGLISGTSTELLNAAMLQFSQGLVTGTFQAQEFQSVLENVPAIAGEIAAGMGITVQELIALKKEGRLVSEDVFRALVDRADEISEKAAGMPIRLNRGLSRFTLGIQQALGEIDKTTGATLKLGTAFFNVGEQISELPLKLAAIKSVLGETFTPLQNAAQTTTNRVSTFFSDMHNRISENMVRSFGLTAEAIQKSQQLSQNFTEVDVDTAGIGITQKYYETLERLRSEHAERMRNIQVEADKNDLDNIQQKTYLQVKMEEWKNRTIQNLNLKNNKEQTDMNATMFRQQIDAAGASSKEFAELSKAFALFDIAVKTPQAVAGAFAFGTSISGGNPAVGAIMAGIAGSAMAVQAAAISSASFTPRAVGGDVFPNQVYRVNENGPEMFSFGGNDFLATGSSSGHISPAGSFSNNNQPTNVVVNIKTTPGQTAKVTENTGPNGEPIIDVIMQQIDQNVAEGIQRGSSQVSSAITNVFGLNRGLGAIAV
jgi:tape measure domain-containing protein